MTLPYEWIENAATMLTVWTVGLFGKCQYKHTQCSQTAVWGRSHGGPGTLALRMPPGPGNPPDMGHLTSDPRSPCQNSGSDLPRHILNSHSFSDSFSTSCRWIGCTRNHRGLKDKLISIGLWLCFWVLWSLFIPMCHWTLAAAFLPSFSFSFFFNVFNTFLRKGYNFLWSPNNLYT